MKEKWVEIFGHLVPLILSLTWKKFNFLRPLILPRYHVGNPNFRISSRLSFPLSIVHIYKGSWWNDFKTILCCKENMTHFLSTKTKKYTLSNLQQIESSQKPSSSVVPFTTTQKWKPLLAQRDHQNLAD